MTTREQLESFYRFALEQLDQGPTAISIDELLDAWQCQEISEEELSASTSAVQAALQDMEHGDTGRPLADVLAEIRDASNQRRQP